MAFSDATCFAFSRMAHVAMPTDAPRQKISSWSDYRVAA
jgi:hypothetical protein